MAITLAFATDNPHKLQEAAEIVQDYIIAHAVSPIHLIDWKPKRAVMETGATFFDNARLKAQAAMESGTQKETVDIIIGEDSGLIIDALSDIAFWQALFPANILPDIGITPETLAAGFPGIRSNRWLNAKMADLLKISLPQKAAPETSTWEERNLALLRLMQTVPPAKRTARYIAACCAIDTRGRDRADITVEGSVELIIAHEKKGTFGFAYDAIAKFAPMELSAVHFPKSVSEKLTDPALLNIAEIADPAVKRVISHRARALTALLNTIPLL